MVSKRDKKVIFIILLLLFIAGSAKLVADINELRNSASLTGSQSLVKIDSFKLQGKAEYETSGAKGAINGVSFTSTNGHHFFIGKAAWEGITESIQLRELLKRHGLEFIAYADQETYEQYTSRRLFRSIDVKQIQVGEKKFIDLAKGQLKYARKMKWKIFGEIIFVVLVFYFAYRDWSSTKTRITN
jgi:hypothetical protein